MRPYRADDNNDNDYHNGYANKRTRTSEHITTLDNNRIPTHQRDHPQRRGRPTSSKMGYWRLYPG